MMQIMLFMLSLCRLLTVCFYYADWAYYDYYADSATSTLTMQVYVFKPIGLSFKIVQIVL